jgi:succinate-acetate transporter protein
MTAKQEQRSSDDISITNPKVLGLGSLGANLLLWQCYNFGYVNIFLVVALGMFLGGVVQLIAGLLELRAGHNLGFYTFGLYGVFWVVMAFIFIESPTKVFAASGVPETWATLGWFLVTWCIFTLFLLLLALRHHSVLSPIFFTLLIGFALLTADAFWVAPLAKAIGAGILLAGALLSWYLLLYLMCAEVGLKLPLGLPQVTGFFDEEDRDEEASDSGGRLPGGTSPPTAG